MYARFCDASRAHSEQLYCLECRKPRTQMGNKLNLTLSMLCTATYTQNQTKCLMKVELAKKLPRFEHNVLHVKYIGYEFSLRTVKVYSLQIKLYSIP